jgi:hypothetical protein
LLYDKRDDQFLVLAPDLALLRYPRLPTPITSLRLDGPLQVVVVLASAPGYAPINLDRELRRIEGALKVPLDAGRLTLDIIRGRDTLGQLSARLRKPVHVLHVLCHGDLDLTRNEGILLFEDPDGDPDRVTAELLRLQLQKQRGQTQLVLLNACLGAIPAGTDPFSSVGAALMRGGVPAVIAMQFEIAEDTAAELTRVFYSELAAGAPVELALTEARLNIYGRFQSRLDWAIPVLFSRSDSGVLFEVDEQPPAPVRPAGPPTGGDRVALKRLWQQAMTAFFTKDWAQAEVLLTQVAANDPDYEDVQVRLAEAQQQRRLLEQYRQIRDLRDGGQWQAVLGAMDDLEHQQPGYADPDGHRRWAERRRWRDQRYDVALIACERSDWTAALTALRPLLAQFPDDADAKTLFARANDEQQTAEHRRGAGIAAFLRRWRFPLLGGGTALLAVAAVLLALSGMRFGSGTNQEPTRAAARPTLVPSGVTTVPIPGAGVSATTITAPTVVATTTATTAAATDVPTLTATNEPPTIPRPTIGPLVNGEIKQIGIAVDHFDPGDISRVRLIVLHATSARSPGDLAYIQRGGTSTRPVSDHYYIDKEGNISQMVADKDIAWHAGASSWNVDGKIVNGVNGVSISIQLSNLNTGKDPYPQAQYDAAVKLVRYLVAKYNIPHGQVVRGRDIAPTRKTDPAGFPWDQFIDDVFSSTTTSPP